MTRVLVTDSLTQPGEGGGVGLLEEAGVELRFEPRPPGVPEAELIALLEGCDGVLAGSQRYNKEVFSGSPRLRVVARLGVGYDAVDLAAASTHGVAVTTTPGTLEYAVADHTFGLIIALAHQIAQDDRAIRAGRWGRSVWGVDVARKTLGLVGLGRIGRNVAQRARGFEMRILAYDPYPNMETVREFGIELVALEELLGRSDFVSLHLPVTAETRGLMDARRIGLMKPGAFLINTARGPLIDEDALYEALQSGHLGGAGLDVRAAEPPTDWRFNSLENVVMTPHVAATTDGRRLACGTMAATSILQVLRGERPPGLVNVDGWEQVLARVQGGVTRRALTRKGHGTRTDPLSRSGQEGCLTTSKGRTTRCLRVDAHGFSCAGAAPPAGDAMGVWDETPALRWAGDRAPRCRSPYFVVFAMRYVLLLQPIDRKRKVAIAPCVRRRAERGGGSHTALDLDVQGDTRQHRPERKVSCVLIDQTIGSHPPTRHPSTPSRAARPCGVPRSAPAPWPSPGPLPPRPPWRAAACSQCSSRAPR